MADESLLKYSRNLLVYDAVHTMFKAYLAAIHYDIPNERLEELIDKYLEMYNDYVIQSFEELDLKLVQTKEKKYMLIDELMVKVTNIVAAKLVAELLLVELRKEI